MYYGCRSPFPILHCPDRYDELMEGRTIWERYWYCAADTCDLFTRNIRFRGTWNPGNQKCSEKDNSSGYALVNPQFVLIFTVCTSLTQRFA